MGRVLCLVMSLSLVSTHAAAQGLTQAVHRAAENAALVAQQNQGGLGQGQGQGKNRLLIPGLVAIGAGPGLFVLGNGVWTSEPADYQLCVQFVGDCDDYKIKNAAAMGVGVAAMSLGAGLTVRGAISKNITTVVKPTRHGVIVQQRIKLR